ncbi:MAG: histidine kinase [Flavipsychrobacter sp.]|nr:histidine kinase [Flavipsychrobacter sp.]
MTTAALPHNEQERLKAINDYYILDTLPEEDFDDITRLASEICHTPISLVSIIDAQRQWIKSKKGFHVSEIARDSAICAHTINHPDEVFVVNDLSQDERFKWNPYVTGKPHVMFYAGVPLVTPEGYALGTLSVWDHEPRELSEAQICTLRSLGRQLVTQLELRKKIMQLDSSEAELKRAYADLEKFAVIASHDLKSPMNNIISICHLLSSEYGAKLDAEGNDYVNYLNQAAGQLSNLVTGILNYSRSSQLLTEDKEHINIPELIAEVKGLINAPANCSISYREDNSTIFTSRIALKQILLNLLQNAIKHNNKPHIIADVDFQETTNAFTFIVRDNGAGIPNEDAEKIFDLFETLHKTGDSTGIGLSVVKRLVEKLGGEIKVETGSQSGAAFVFTIPK